MNLQENFNKINSCLFTGTRVQLLSPRPRDNSRAGFVNWPLMSVATWGESPHGFWEITVEDEVNIIHTINQNI